MVVYSGKKRRYGYGKGAITVRNPMYGRSMPISKALVPGVTRTGGFYGRYGGRTGELKFFDTAVNFQVDATGEVPATGQWNLIPQGVTESQRVGRRCTIRSIQFRGTMEYVPAASTVGTAVVHLFVVLDKQCNGAAASVTDVLTSNAMGSALVNLENRSRFVILKRWVWPMNAQAGVQGAFGRMSRNAEWYKKCKIPIDFDSSASTGAIGTIRSNNIFVLAGTSNEDDAVGFVGTARVRFSDN